MSALQSLISNLFQSQCHLSIIVITIRNQSLVDHQIHQKRRRHGTLLKQLNELLQRPTGLQLHRRLRLVQQQRRPQYQPKRQQSRQAALAQGQLQAMIIVNMEQMVL